MDDPLLSTALRILDRYATTRPSPPDLRAVRHALGTFMFDPDTGVQRDDVLNICQRIDDVPSGEGSD